MNILLFGPQGSGKGTQAEFLAKKFKLYHLSIGDELRREILNKTAIGKKIEKIVDSGKLVPSKIPDAIALKKSKSKEAKNGIIFDGYPRNKPNWIFVKKNFKIDAAIEISIPDSESIKRIASRRVCPKCGKGYNTIWLKPKKCGICNIDGAKLKQRDDDKPHEIKKRLEIYHSQTEPLRQEYRKMKIFYTINGNQPIKKVQKDFEKLIRSLK